MANVKFSAIAASGTALTSATDVLMGVRSGTTDLTWTPAQVATFMWASPTLVTPTLGVATATSVNKVTITAPATSAVLTIPDGVTLTGPAASGTAMTLGNAEAVSGIKTFATGQIVNGTLRLGTISSVTGQLLLANSSSANLTTIQAGNAAAARTYTWPTDFGAAGTVLTDAAGNGTLSWAAGGGGSNTYTHTLSGNVSAAAWTTTGIGLVGAAASFTDTSSSGTVAAMYVNRLGIGTILASSATTYTDAYGLWIEPPTASTNVTITNKWAAGINGNVKIVGANNSLMLGSSLPFGIFQTFNSMLYFGIPSVTYMAMDSTGFFLRSGGLINWSTSNSDPFATQTQLSSPGAAILQQGKADAAAPVAQTTQVQSVVAGTSNTAGVDWTLIGSKGTGTGAGGKIIFKTAATGSTGSSQNTTAAQLTIDGPGNIVAGNAAIATNASDGFFYAASGAGTPTGTPTTYTGRVPIYIDTTNSSLWLYLGGAWKQPKTPAGAAIVSWQ